jgi:DNA-binding transcriptional ArsR family regulator
VSDVDSTLTALADPTRRAVVDLLADGPTRASEIAEALETSRPAMSRHLKILRQAGIIEEDRMDDDGRARRYQLRREPFDDLRGWIEEVEAFWTDQLLAFKRHAEAKAAKRRRK